MSFSAAGANKDICNIDKFGVKIAATYPHLKENFTQGLAYESGILYESTGLFGRSTVQTYSFDSPVKPQRNSLAPGYFGEGLAIAGDNIVQLTYRSGIAFVYDKSTLKSVGSFSYKGEGWGLTYNGKELVMSDGSHVLRFYDPEKFVLLRNLQVTRCGRPVGMLNELEYIEGRIYANVWQTDDIVMIDPHSGAIVGEIDLSSIAVRYKDDSSIDVLNGIAWDADNKRLFVTGKFWPHLYQVELVNPVLKK